MFNKILFLIIFFQWSVPTLMANTYDVSINSNEINPLYTPYNAQFNNQFTFNFGIMPGLTNYANINSFGLHYRHTSLENPKKFSFDFAIQATQAAFQNIAENNQTATQASSDLLYNTKEDINSFGLGSTIETNLFSNLLSFTGIENIYEQSSAFITFNLMKENYNSKMFIGPGAMAKFQVAKRFNNYFSLGPSFTYQIMSVTRDLSGDATDQANTTIASRSLSVGIFTWGLNFSIYL